MDDLLEIGRPVFLHFLDRETATVAEERRSEAEDISVIEILTTCHSGGLSINLHPLALYFTGKPALMAHVLQLNQRGILSNTSHNRNIAEFIPSRQQMYSNVPELVPIFFRDEDTLSRFSIHKANRYSMTDLIRADIFGYSPAQLVSFAPRAKPGDKWQFGTSLDTIQKVVFSHSHAAITVGNIAHLANAGDLPPQSLPAMRRVFSALYQEHYCDRNLTVTATGIPRLTSLADDYTYFPHYDIPVLQELLRTIEWQKLEGSVAGLREYLLETYASHEHRAFVESLHAFLHACTAQAKSTLNMAVIDGDSAPAFRSMIRQISSIAVLHAKDLRAVEFKELLSFYRTAKDLLVGAAIFAATRWPSFRSAWESTAVSQSYVPPTGYPNLDRRMLEIRDQLRLMTPLAEQDISDALTLLAPLANLAQQAAHDNKFKKELSEYEFQERIKHDLRGNPQIGGELEEHPHRGGGIADLSFRGISIELKSEASKSMNLEDCRRFVDQALSYGVASGVRIAVLCVLDCSKKTRPPFPVEDGIGILVSQRSRSPMFVVTVLIQGNLARPSSHS